MAKWYYNLGTNHLNYLIYFLFVSFPLSIHYLPSPEGKAGKLKMLGDHAMS